MVNVCAQLFSIPLFLHVWNKELYGEWIVLTAVPSLLWSLEGGLGVLAANRMTLATAVNDWTAANKIFQTTLLCQVLLSALLFVGTLIVAHSVPIATFFGFHRTNNSAAAYILVVMVVYMLFGLMMSVYRAAYRASEFESRGSMLVNFWRMSDLGIIVLVLLARGSPVQMADCLVAGILIWTALGYLDVRRKCKNVIFGFSSISWTPFKEMFVHGVPLILFQITIALYMQGFPLVVNRTLGSAAVVTLTTLRTVSRLGLLIVQTVALSSSPQLSKSYGVQDWSFFGRFVKIMATVSFWSAIFMSTGLTIFGPWLIYKWTGGKLLVDHSTIGLFALSVSFQGFWTCFMVVLDACNRHHFFCYCYFLITLASLGVALFMVEPFGFNSIPAVMLVADILVVLSGLFFFRKNIPQYRLNELSCIVRISFYRNLVSDLSDHLNGSTKIGA